MHALGLFIVFAASLTQASPGGYYGNCDNSPCNSAVYRGPSQYTSPVDGAYGDCTSYFATTVNQPWTKTTTVTVTGAPTTKKMTNTVTSTLTKTASTTKVNTLTTTAFTTTQATFTTTKACNTTVEKVTSTTTITQTTTTTPSSIRTSNPTPTMKLRDLNLRGVTSPVCKAITTTASSIPAYASKYCDAAAYSSACTCMGAAHRTNTVSASTACATSTVTTTVTPTVSAYTTTTTTVTSTVTATATQFTTTTATQQITQVSQSTVCVVQTGKFTVATTVTKTETQTAPTFSATACPILETSGNHVDDYLVLLDPAQPRLKTDRNFQQGGYVPSFFYLDAKNRLVSSNGRYVFDSDITANGCSNLSHAGSPDTPNGSFSSVLVCDRSVYPVLKCAAQQTSVRNRFGAKNGDSTALVDFCPAATGQAGDDVTVGFKFAC